MPARPRLLLVALVALGIVAACDTGQPEPSGGSEPPSSATTEAPADGEVLAYGFEAGDVIRYEVEIEQHIVLESAGDPGALADADTPQNADVTVTAAGPFTYEVAEGPEPDTFGITVPGEFDQTTVDGTADGEPVDDVADIADLGVAQPVSSVVVVDRQGRILEEGDPATDALGLGATPLAGLTGDLGRVPGPILSTEPVATGSTWTETTTDAAFGDEPVETVTEATVSGAEPLDEVDTLRIEAVSQTGRAEIDLADFFVEFMGSFTEDPESAAALADEVVFRITVDPSSTESTTWFDPELGLARQVTTTGPPTAFLMEVALPDEDTGDLQSSELRLSVSQSLTYSLVGGGS